MRSRFLLIFVFILLLCSCTDRNATWQLSSVIALDNINPIGLTFTDEGLWLSDGDRNRLVLIDEAGKMVRKIDSLDRPMHIDSDQNTIFVPLYGDDVIAKISKMNILALPVQEGLDAPAGVSVSGNEVAIADFYNHRILYSPDGVSYSTIGKEGKGEGEFNYPTDVQLTNDKIWVADAYNNRVQVFDKRGNFVRIIGADQGFNAATGLFVSEDELFITDFENNRVLVFDHQGALKQIITNSIEKPTDVLKQGDFLYIVNYRSASLLLYERKLEE